MMKSLLISIMLLGLISSATIPGYAYNNIVAQKTTKQVSDHESTLQIGVDPVIEIVGLLIVAIGTPLAGFYGGEVISCAFDYFGAYKVTYKTVSRPVFRTIKNYYNDGRTEQVFSHIKNVQVVDEDKPPFISSPNTVIAIAAITIIVIIASVIYIWWSET